MDLYYSSFEIVSYLIHLEFTSINVIIALFIFV